MKKEPKISIITATFNIIKNKREELFKQSFNSVVNQTYKNIEYIIIDGNSNDGTVNFIKQYDKTGNLKIYSEPDKGIYDAFNKGLFKASGDYILYLGSDDFLYSNNAIEEMVETIIEEEVDWVYGNTIYLTNQGQICKWKGTLDAIPFGSAPCHQSTLISIKSMKNVGGFDINNKVADIDLMMKLIKNNYKSASIDKCLSVFRGGGESSKQETDSGFKQDFINSFYSLFGMQLGLSLDECESLYAGECFHTLKNKELNNIGLRLGYSNWIKTFFNRQYIILNTSPTAYRSTKTFCVLNIPIFKYRKMPAVKRFYIFEIPIFKIAHKMNRIIFSIFEIPVIKIKI